MQETWSIIKSLSKCYNIPWKSSKSVHLNQFQFSPKDLQLPIKSNCHLWLININKFNDIVFLDCLSEGEKIKYDKILPEIERKSKIKSRILLRLILSVYLKTSPEKLSFFYNVNGKPYLTNNISKIHFNVSHSGYFLTIVVDSKHQVGIDIETDLRIENINLKIAKRFFFNEEYEVLKTLEGIEQSLFFNKLWTLKEAYLKSSGEGVFFIDQCPNFSFLEKKFSESYIEYYHTEKNYGFSFYSDGISISTAKNFILDQ